MKFRTMGPRTESADSLDFFNRFYAASPSFEPAIRRVSQFGLDFVNSKAELRFDERSLFGGSNCVLEPG